MGTVIATALGAALVWGAADFLGGLSSRVLHAVTVVLWVNACGLVVMATLALASGASLPADGAAWAVGAGVASGAAFAVFYTAMAAGPMSVVAPITAAGALLPATVALSGGETIPASAGVGLACALIGSVLAARATSERGGANGVEGSRAEPALGRGGAVPAGAPTHAVAAPPSSAHATTRVVALAVTAGIGIGAVLALLQQATASDASPAAAVAVQRGVALTLTLGIALAIRAPRGVPASNRTAVLAVGLADTAANLLFAAASDAGSHAVAAVLSSLYPVTTVVLARAVLRERMGRVQLAGVALAFVGVALVSAA